MKTLTVCSPAVLAVLLGLSTVLPVAHAQLSLQGRIASKISAVSASSGTMATAAYAATPPGYITTGSVDQPGADVSSSGLDLTVSSGPGWATLFYEPTAGTANPLNAFSAPSLSRVSLGMLSLVTSELPTDGSVAFVWTTEFATLQVFDGLTPVSDLFTNVPILVTPMTLSLWSETDTAALTLDTPEVSLEFALWMTLGNYRVQLTPGEGLWDMLMEMNAGLFTATPGESHGTCEADMWIEIAPVPEPSTYALGAALLLIGVVGYRRMQRRA